LPEIYSIKTLHAIVKKRLKRGTSTNPKRAKGTSNTMRKLKRVRRVP
jgi:hypothetical protein